MTAKYKRRLRSDKRVEKHPSLSLRQNYRRSLTGLLIGTFIVTISCFPSDGWPVKSYRELNYRYVKGQNKTKSCGPASLATLLSKFYGKNITEEEIIEIILPYFTEEVENLNHPGNLPDSGLSMLDLKNAMWELNVPTRGYKIPKTKLLPIIEGLKTPILLHLVKPEEHFVLAVGEESFRLILADPAVGLRTIGLHRVINMWDGLVLAFNPDRKYRAAAEYTVRKIAKLVRKKMWVQKLAVEFSW